MLIRRQKKPNLEELIKKTILTSMKQHLELQQ